MTLFAHGRVQAIICSIVREPRKQRIGLRFEWLETLEHRSFAADFAGDLLNQVFYRQEFWTGWFQPTNPRQAFLITFCDASATRRLLFAVYAYFHFLLFFNLQSTYITRSSELGCRSITGNVFFRLGKNTLVKIHLPCTLDADSTSWNLRSETVTKRRRDRNLDSHCTLGSRLTIIPDREMKDEVNGLEPNCKRPCLWVYLSNKSELLLSKIASIVHDEKLQGVLFYWMRCVCKLVPVVGVNLLNHDRHLFTNLGLDCAVLPVSWCT